jgi:hypothetical protein
MTDTDDIPRCTATSSRTGERCRNRPVRGATVCSTHGGLAPQVRAAAERRLQQQAAERAAATYGLPREIDPTMALLEEVYRTAGHVAWLGELVASLEHGGVGYAQTDDGDLVPRSGLKQLDRSGKFEKPSVWVELYQSERRHLREVCRDVIAAGIDERIVRLAEQQGALLESVLRRVTDALFAAVVALLGERAAPAALSEAMRAAWPGWVAEIAPRELRAANGGEAA